MTWLLIGAVLRLTAFTPRTGGALVSAQGQDTTALPAIRQAERERHDALLRGDVPTLGRLLADDYVGTGARGKVRSRAEVLADYGAHAVTYESILEDDVAIRVHGNAAIVTGRSRSKGKEGGKAFDGEHRFTRVWVQASGRWVLVANQSSPIR